VKPVFQHIAACSAQYAENPIFQHLRDPGLEPRKRLEFVPYISHFVLSFADLYNFFLIEEPARDRYQELVNAHLSEESSHWKWFLTDLETMGLNPSLKFTDTLKLLWGPDTLKTRALAYEVGQLNANLSSLERLVLVHAIEATGRVALEALVPVGVEFAKASSRKLVYFGQHHLDTERAHTVEEDETKRFLESIPVSAEQVVTLCQLVDRVFSHFEAFAHEAFARASSGQSFPALHREASA
jgi:hypothetical protein